MTSLAILAPPAGNGSGRLAVGYSATTPRATNDPKNSMCARISLPVGDHRQVGVGLDDADQGPGLDPQGPPDLEQDLVSGRLDDDLVEPGIVDELFVDLSGFGGAAHRLKLVGKSREDLVGHPDRGFAPGHFLERGSHRVDLAQFLARHGADPGADVWLALDKSHALEVAQRLPDRRLAGAEFLGELALDDAGAGRVGPVEDALDDALLDHVAQHSALGVAVHPCSSPDAVVTRRCLIDDMTNSGHVNAQYR